MGVQGLWKLLESTGRPVTLESLEGKVLAVDVSLWLHQAMRGMRDDKGNVVANAHLHVLFNRICKLLFFRIKPVFVFDGAVPELKRQTMVSRRQRREIAGGKSKRTTEKIIKNYLQTHALHAVMGGAGGSKVETVPRLKKIASTEPDIYELPPVPPPVLQESESDSEEGPDLVTDHLGRYQNLDDIDIDSENFKALPPEIQHEMIIEMKEARKRSSWKMIDRLPKDSSDFSDYQVKKLLNKGKMTKRMEVLCKEMSERHAGAIASSLDLDGGEGHSLEAGRIMSEDAHHYLLVKRQPVKLAEDEETLSGDGEQTEEVETKDEKDGENDSVRGRISEDFKGQGSSQLPWESDVIVIDDAEEEETNRNPAEQIRDIVKNFFRDQRGSVGSDLPRQDSEGTKGLPSDAKDIIVLDHEGLSGQRSDSDVEIIQPEAGNGEDSSKGSSQVVILDDGDQKELTMSLTHNKKTSVSQSGENSSLASATLGTLPQHSEAPSTDVSQASGLSVQDLRSPDVISIDADEDDDLPVRSGLEIQEESLSAIRDDKSGIVADVGGVMVVTEESSDDDDFVEVLDQPVIPKQQEELFPASAFTPSLDVSEESSLASSPSKMGDIHPPSTSEPRIDAEGIAMDSAAMAMESDDAGKVQSEEEENDDFDDDVEDEDAEMESLREAARQEWQDMNVDNVPLLEENLASQRQVLQAERGKQERVAASVTDVMYAESKELLELFGLPYVDSPQEAEAQCAFLDRTDQTQGTITDDSDVWLFGGRSVYKNFFTRGKDVECFKCADVEKQLFLDRSKLITLAMLLGSDYTEGIKGIGSVTAMEVLTEFPGEGVQLLQAFKSWWDAAHEQLMPPVESQLKGKLRKLELPSSFPNHLVFDAYWSPTVDESMEEFSWQSPDLGLLRDFAKEKLGWTRTKVDEVLLPVMKKLNENTTQSKITTFYPVEREAPRKVTSKRLKRVLRHFSRPLATDEKEDHSKKRKAGATVVKGTVSTEKKAKKRRTKSNREDLRKNEDAVSMDAVSMDTSDDEDGDCEEAGSSRRRLRKTKNDIESSEEEYTVTNKLKAQIDSTKSRSTRSSQRTRKDDAENFTDKPFSLAEFQEIEEAMFQKTEGMISRTGKNGQNSGKNADPLILKTSKASETPTQQPDSTSAETELGTKKLGQRKEQGKRGRGRGRKGQRGRGKGQAGLKGKEKAISIIGRHQGGPVLSESSSSGESDE